jgi:hypothetical protein
LQDITSSYAQERFVKDGGWASVVPASGAADRRTSATTSVDDRKAAGLCAAELAARATPALGQAELSADQATTAQ